MSNVIGVVPHDLPDYVLPHIHCELPRLAADLAVLVIREIRHGLVVMTGCNVPKHCSSSFVRWHPSYRLLDDFGHPIFHLSDIGHMSTCHVLQFCLSLAFATHLTKDSPTAFSPLLHLETFMVTRSKRVGPAPVTHVLDARAFLVVSVHVQHVNVSVLVHTSTFDAHEACKYLFEEPIFMGTQFWSASNEHCVLHT